MGTVTLHELVLKWIRSAIGMDGKGPTKAPPGVTKYYLQIFNVALKHNFVCIPGSFRFTSAIWTGLGENCPVVILNTCMQLFLCYLLIFKEKISVSGK